jgi:large subunit ribosomal protein L15
LHELALVEADVIDLLALKAANLVSQEVLKVKVIASGTIEKAVNLRGIAVTKGARAAIESAGGKIEE